MVNSKSSTWLIVYFFLVCCIAYVTYFKNYHNPPKEFWDENYHIASAQKYIDGIAFMEPHPPLGKLFIALGEVIKKPNEQVDKSSFLTSDYIKNFPKDLSYEGYRLFPTVFATLNGIIFFFIVYLIIKNIHISFLLSCLYLFENAIIVHSRAAMLESIQLFFIFLAILYFIFMTQKDKIIYWEYLFLGMVIGLGVSVKLNGLIMVMLLFFLLFFEYLKKESAWKKFIQEQIIKQFLACFGLIAVFIMVFYIHAALGKKMPKHTNYSISKEYKTIIKNEETHQILKLPVIFQDNLTYIKNYSKNVPRYNPCKEGENGSFCLTWPFGNKSINYRWEKENENVRYLYLQGNMLVWLSAFFAVVLAFGLLISRFVYQTPIKNRITFLYIVTFLSMYASYMFVMYQIERVMYLYHYFVPLIFGLILVVLIFYYLFEAFIESHEKRVLIGVSGFAFLVVCVYLFFSPLTYYEPLSTQEFQWRNWFDFWKLKPIL